MEATFPSRSESMNSLLNPVDPPCFCEFVCNRRPQRRSACAIGISRCRYECADEFCSRLARGVLRVVTRCLSFYQVFTVLSLIGATVRMLWSPFRGPSRTFQFIDGPT